MDNEEESTLVIVSKNMLIGKQRNLSHAIVVSCTTTGVIQKICDRSKDYAEFTRLYSLYQNSSKFMDVGELFVIPGVYIS